MSGEAMPLRYRATDRRGIAAVGAVTSTPAAVVSDLFRLRYESAYVFTPDDSEPEGERLVGEVYRNNDRERMWWAES